jgi:hypothetical protein
MRERPVDEQLTKIVATIGPASSSVDQVRALIESGMNVARLNFSHGDRDTHAVVLTRVRDLAEQLGVPLAVPQDLAEPKVRVCPIAGGSVTLETGQAFVLTTAVVDGTRERARRVLRGAAGGGVGQRHSAPRGWRHRPARGERRRQRDPMPGDRGRTSGKPQGCQRSLRVA